MLTETDISKLLRFGERVNLECKEASGGLPKAVWETYSAFANTDGGIILLGIKENLGETDFEKRFTVTGVKNPAKIIKEFWDTINSDSKVNASILIDSDVQVISYGGKNLIYINIPRANYKQRPIYLNGNYLKGTFKRNYEGDYHCTEDEIKAMLRDSNDTGNDGFLLTYYTFDDIDVDTLNSYRNEYKINQPDHVWNSLDNQDFLRKLGGMALDRASGKEWLTAAGLLMFGKGLSIRERFDNIRMDYLDLTNLLPESRWSDRLTYDGTWENNLYNFFRKVMPKLTSDLRRPFAMEGITRIDDTPVHKAIREAFVNLIIHCDFMVTGTLKVEKHNNCFVFINPGSLKLPLQEIYKGGTSIARNPRIQTMMRMLGLGDNIGSGFPTILAAWQKENWRKPDLLDNTELKQVELRLWTISLMPEECTLYMHRIFRNAYPQLSANAQVALCTAYTEGSVSNTRLQSILDMHPADISKLLAELTEGGYLKRNSKGRWTTYTINEVDPVSLFNNPDAEGNTGNNEQVDVQVSEQVDVQVSEQVKKLLHVLGDKTLSRADLMKLVGENSRMRFTRLYLAPALKLELIKMTCPKNSSKQQYRLVHQVENEK